MVVANNNQEEEEDDEEEDEQELKLDLKLEPEDQFNNHQQLNAASSRPTMNNWRTRRRTRNNNSSGETTVSFSQSVTRTQSRHRHRHGSPSQRDASKAKLALAIFLCLASVISLASSNYAPQANDGKFLFVGDPSVGFPIPIVKWFDVRPTFANCPF